MAATSVRRVFVEDERRDGKFLRVTWHADQRTFVVSTWDGSVCVGATRIPVVQAPALIDVLAFGLADAATPGAPPPRSLRDHLRAWWRHRTTTAAVVDLRRASRAGARRSA